MPRTGVPDVCGFWSRMTCGGIMGLYISKQWLHGFSYDSPLSSLEVSRLCLWLAGGVGVKVPSYQNRHKLMCWSQPGCSPYLIQSQISLCRSQLQVPVCSGRRLRRIAS